MPVVVWCPYATLTSACVIVLKHIQTTSASTTKAFWWFFIMNLLSAYRKKYSYKNVLIVLLHPIDNMAHAEALFIYGLIKMHWLNSAFALMSKVYAYGIFKNCANFCQKINQLKSGYLSGWGYITKIVPQETRMGPSLCNVFYKRHVAFLGCV